MDKGNHRKTKNSIVGFIGIKYQGADAEEESKSLHDEIYRQLSLRIDPPMVIGDHIGKLGIAEVIVTITLAPIFSYAITPILDFLRDFFRKRTQKACNGQIIIKLERNDLGKSFPFYIEVADWDKLFELIEKYIRNLRGKSLLELIENRVKIDEEIRKLFEVEATFLNIGIVSIKKIWESEPDLMVFAYSLEQYHKYVQEKVETHGGKLLITIADELVAWFATPYDAISCTATIFRDRDEFNNKSSKLHCPFQFKIGINTILPLIDYKEKKIFDKSELYLVQRLQKKAKPGGFLISERTYQKLENKSCFKKYKYIDNKETWCYVIFEG